MSLDDQDQYFTGQIDASTPGHLVSAGTIRRLINGRFIEGAVTNAYAFDELEWTFIATPTVNRDGYKPFASGITHEQLIKRGDVQLVAPLDNFSGRALVFVVSGILYKMDLETCAVREITPRNDCLPESSYAYPLSYLDNDGGVLGAGGYLVIFNYPNKNIFVDEVSARLARTESPDFEAPPFRAGATAAGRMFAVSGNNLLYASDPLGGASALAPLTFQETLDAGPPAASYYQQIFTIGSALDSDYVTAIARMPRYLSSSQDFLAQQVMVSTRRRKYIVAAAAPRADWENQQFISYAGSTPGIAGPLAVTNVGDVLVYLSTTGRIKTIQQDRERETALAETFMDESLGQYLSAGDRHFHHRDWYRELDHSRSIVKFHRDRLYATVYPVTVPAKNRYGESAYAPSHRALAVASLDSRTRLGPTAQLAWEGFYDWLKPIGLVTINDDFYVVSKDSRGIVRFYRENPRRVDDHTTILYTRAYFAGAAGHSKSTRSGVLYFRKLSGAVKVCISILVDDTWVQAYSGKSDKLAHHFTLNKKWQTNSSGMPLRIEIDHRGCRFELEAIRIKGETHMLEK